MRGVFFKQALEFRIEVTGDEWHQGDKVLCTLSVKNRGSSPQPLSGLYLHLALGNIKKVREKADDAFQVVSSAQLTPPAALEPEQQQVFPCSFALDVNCPITDKGGSLYLLCGQGTPADAAGNLLVTVLPHPHLEAVVSLLESSFCFVLKGQKWQKGWVEAKLKPPAGLEYPTLEQLVLAQRFEGELLQLKYNFNLRSLAATPTTLEVKKGKRELQQQVAPQQYLFGGMHVNNDALEAVIREALQSVNRRA